MIDKTVPASKATGPQHASVASASRLHMSLRFVRVRATSNLMHDKGRRDRASAAARRVSATYTCRTRLLLRTRHA
jgi:hypothetical protein